VRRQKEVEGILETRTDSAVALARAEEAEAVALLHRLNGQYIRAFVEADVAWYVENLTADFTCSLSDGTRIGKEAFLRKIASGPGVTDVRYDEVDVRPLGDVALVHGVTHYVRNGEPASTRYTDVWRREAGRWRAVAAQLTGVGN
jgi:ketosteroid isomerase-like protein